MVLHAACLCFVADSKPRDMRFRLSINGLTSQIRFLVKNCTGRKFRGSAYLAALSCSFGFTATQMRAHGRVQCDNACRVDQAEACHFAVLLQSPECLLDVVGDFIGSPNGIACRAYRSTGSISPQPSWRPAYKEPESPALLSTRVYCNPGARVTDESRGSNSGRSSSTGIGRSDPT